MISTDSYPNEVFEGKVSAIDPKVDPKTRNIRVQGTLENDAQLLLPGMFVVVETLIGEKVNYLTLPQTAISYNPYGELVFLVQEDKEQKDNESKPILTVTQRFVTVGDVRGDQIAILNGLQEGDRVVTSGQLKLKNGTQIKINNSVVPNNESAPTPVDE